MKIGNIEEENDLRNFNKIFRKNLTLTKRDFTLSLENTVWEKPPGGFNQLFLMVWDPNMFPPHISPHIRSQS